MKLFYTTVLTVLIFALSIPAQAQTTMNIPDNGDPAVPTDIFDVIMGDTASDGTRNDPNTIYTLDNGVIYQTTGRLVNKPDWPLQIQAVDLNNLTTKPILTRTPNATGNYPDIMRAEGDVTLLNLHIISGEKAAGEQHDWGKIRFLGPKTRVVVEDCIIEKDRGGFLQLRADSVKMYVNNCILRNGGNRKIREGNGRGIDSRNFAFDTLIVRNTIIHNIIDRVFRSLGNTVPHNYIEFDRNTVFNAGGRHGTFVFELAKHVKVTNNLLINPMMLGDTPFNTDEQNNPDDGNMHIFTIDTLLADTKFDIHHNNIFYTQDVIDAWANTTIPDTIDRPVMPDVYSSLIKESMGDDTLNSYIMDVITLNNVPQNITQYVIDHYTDPGAEDMFDFVVEDSLAFGTAIDFGNLFKFSDFDPCYDAMSASATAGEGGSSLGYVIGCAGLTNVNSIKDDINDLLNLTVAPNPFNQSTTISYNLTRPGMVQMNVFDATGKVVSTLVNGPQRVGEQRVEWTANARLSSGLYFLVLKTDEGYMTKKMMLN
ncbi:MAG: T9SS type A sorting domain-containing protein [Bacteroidota bacterium]